MKKQLTDYIEKQLSQSNYHNEGGKMTLSLFKEEKAYVEEQNLIEMTNVSIEEKEPELRFQEAYIERCYKETEEVVSTEDANFLSQSIQFLKQHKDEFIYLDSEWFELIQVSDVSFELDDVFGTYNMMIGFKQPKKTNDLIREYIKSHSIGAETEPELLFNQNDGLWDLNLAINYIEGFNEHMSLNEAFQLLYRFVFQLNVYIEQN